MEIIEADKPKKLYMDSPNWAENLKPDDFLVSVGEKKSNSVYHVLELTKIERRGRIKRQHIKVLKSDLLTLINRDPEQKLITFSWYRRKKKSK